ncbi:MAG: alginate lyase family protein [Tannerella sp.]|jgi:hypothetical protein|nr:alginate lyase family protein [Tannerella sp.]
MKYNRTVILLCSLILVNAAAQEHPHIAINNERKGEIIRKMEEHQWAKDIFNGVKNEIDTFVTIHQNDPEWILSRYLMNRAEGRRYTRFISDEQGNELVGYGGDAPVPTIRVSPHKRGPVTPQAGSYRMPEIGELVPYDTSMTMILQNGNTKEYERVDPKSMVGSINSRFNEMTFKASVIYWLTGDERYARFAADLLDQWVKGAYYQQPVEGPGRTGFINIQTLGDEASKNMIFAYDFLQPYMKTKAYDLSFYEAVFEKIARTLAYRGYTENNWYAAESSTLVAAALALDSRQKSDYYLQYFLSKDTVINGIGQIALPTTVNKWLTADGHWREPGGYHNYPVSKLLESALLLENNGFDVFRRFPQLFKASFAMIHYSFPNLTAAAFGDTGRPRQSAECLETGLLMAEKYRMPIYEEMMSVMQLMLRNGYDRSKNGMMALLHYLPEIKADHAKPFLWNRSETLDFAEAYYQRNGMDAGNGMMYVVHGASYNHNHANGMSMELYGKGRVTGADPGNGPNYEHPMHVNYYAVWAAHNTVVAAGASSSVPRSTGGGGTKRIGKIRLVAIEPAPKAKAVSENFSFTDTKYVEASTKTNQQRTMALIRTSDTTGYYLDIFRSDNNVSNDYLYHNTGDYVALFNEKGDPVATSETVYPVTGDDIPGLRFLKEAQTTGLYQQSLKAHFYSSGDPDGAQSMDVWIPASGNKYFYTARAPVTKTASPPYNRLPTPVLTIRTEGGANAWNDPFIAIFEPYWGDSGGTITGISRKISGNGARITVEVERGDCREIIFQSIDDNGEFTGDRSGFTGRFGIISLSGGKLKSMYIGQGGMIRHENIKIETLNEEGISVCATLHDNILSVNSSSAAKLTFGGVSYDLKEGMNELATLWQTPSGRESHLPQ